MSVLKLDEDLKVSSYWRRLWLELVLKPVCEHFQVKVLKIKVRPSPSKGTHVQIFLNRKLRATTINLMQWLLGDDRLRCAWNTARIRAGFLCWNRLWVTGNMNPYANTLTWTERLLNWLRKVVRKQ